MPFPTTIRTTRVLKEPGVRGDALVERVAAELRRAGVGSVSTGQSLVQFDAAAGETSPAAGPGNLVGSGEVEVRDNGKDVELIVEADIGRVPLAFGAGAVVASTLAGGAHTISLGGGLIAGALIALVPWFIARQRLAACLRRVAAEVEPRR